MNLTLEQYRRAYFSKDSRPHLDTLRRRCRLKQIEGAFKQGGAWYVNVELKQQLNIHVNPDGFSDNVDELETIFKGLMA